MARIRASVFWSSPETSGSDGKKYGEADPVILSASNCKPILDSEEGEINMALDGKNNVKLTPLVASLKVEKAANNLIWRIAG